jgi:hypothetical protein
VVKGQTINKISPNDGIWQDYGAPLSAQTYPEFHGRLVNVNWSDIEDSSNNWNWAIFDSDVTMHVADSMPVIILVYTGPNAPAWLYSSGVPQVFATDSSGNVLAYSPYYLDTNYNNYFKRMIDTVNLHIQSYPSSTRNLIIGIQGCYGSTGDPISYKGIVPLQYQISSAQFDSLFKVYSLYYYNDYRSTTPPIRLLSNPNTTDSTETYWLLNNCPGGWLKCGTFAKGSQINMELDKQSWLYTVLNQPQSGQFIMSRSEIVGQQLYTGRWLEDHYKEMFGIMCYCIYWGLDWPNETSDFISDHNNDSSFAFFNKYAGQKIPGLATNAMCALKDALDASDSIRFPSGTYGAVLQTNTSRYMNIYNAYSSYGAKLEDTAAATSYDLGSLSARGINDVGWHLLPGNYERYLHQINANATSAGYWNVDDADSTVMYGRYARGFDMANKKNALYFDVDDNFLRNAPLKGAYPIVIEITYFDSGNGSWGLFYDAVGNSNKASVRVVCTNTNTWKKYRIVLSDANFGNGSVKNSDFYIQNLGRSNVIFSVIELSRPQLPDAGFITTGLNPFDTTCINSVLPPNSFILHAALLDGSNVQIGPYEYFSFSTSSTGTFTDSLIINNYSNNIINQTIYVKINTANAVNILGNIPVAGGGKKKGYVSVKASVVNSNPALNAVVSNVSCYNNKNGFIDLQPTGGIGPFSYKWTNDVQQFWNDTTQNIDSLVPANYTVVVNAAYGCSNSDTFAITQPQSALLATVLKSSNIICKGGSTMVNVRAFGGTPPYSGTGRYAQFAGYQSYPVSDINNCTDTGKMTINDGILVSPPKPVGINGPKTVTANDTGLVYKVKNSNAGYIYHWTVSGGSIISGQGTSSIIVNWGTSSGTISVYASNPCGNSDSTNLNISVKNSGLTGNSELNILEATAKKLYAGNAITLMPNPVKDIATVKFFSTKSEVYSLEITDVHGSTLSIQKNIARPGTNLEKLDVAQFSGGIYFITLIEQTGERKTIQMIKQ